MSSNGRKSPWVAHDVWYKAREKAAEEGADFAADLRDLVTAYADGLFEIDPREIPETDPSRQGRAVFPTPDGWERACKRAQAEGVKSASVMVECIVTRYLKGHIMINRTHTVIEVQKVRRTLMNAEGGGDIAPPVVKGRRKKAA